MLVGVAMPILHIQGREGDLGSHAPALEDLDLSSNLLSSWLDVQRLCQELPRLHTLNLSHNIMQHAALSDHTQYTSLQRLILNNCRISFSQVDFKELGWLEKLDLQL